MVFLLGCLPPKEKNMNIPGCNKKSSLRFCACCLLQKARIDFIAIDITDIGTQVWANEVKTDAKEFDKLTITNS